MNGGWGRQVFYYTHIVTVDHQDCVACLTKLGLKTRRLTCSLYGARADRDGARERMSARDQHGHDGDEQSRHLRRDAPAASSCEPARA